MGAACNLQLIFHGSLTLVISQLAGYAFFHAIPRAAPDRVAMWRMSHAACSAGAVLLLALGPVVPHLELAPMPAKFLVASMIMSTYLLCFGTVVAGITGNRGTAARPPRSNQIVFMCYVLGAVGSSLAALVLLFGAATALLR